MPVYGVGRGHLVLPTLRNTWPKHETGAFRSTFYEPEDERKNGKGVIMATREIPKSEWKEFFDSFSRLHQGWLADVQVLGGQTTRHYEVKGLPFRGASYDTKGTGGNQVDIFIDQSPKEDITHTINSPTHIRLEQTDTGADQGLEVEGADGTKTVVRFRNPMPPDEVDRM